MRRTAVFGMVLALLFILSSCSPSPEMITYAGARSLPDLRLGKAEYLLKTDDEQMPIVVQAEEIAIYDTTEKANLTRLEFSRVDKDGKLLFSGTADSANTDTTSYDTTLIGSVEIVDYTRRLTIRAEQLRWLNDQQTLNSESREPIHVTTDDGEEIIGYGLTLKINDSSLSFTEVVHGVVGL